MEAFHIAFINKIVISMLMNSIKKKLSIFPFSFTPSVSLLYESFPFMRSKNFDGIGCTFVVLIVAQVHMVFGSHEEATRKTSTHYYS